MKFILFFLSLIYYFLVELRILLYKFNVLRIKKLPVKTICIGNITAGGTGKTSCVINIAENLIKQKYKPVILIRGYKRKSRKIIFLDNDNTCDVKTAGDEPILLKKKLNIPVIVYANRYKSGSIAVKKYNPDIIILDDGFQHFRLYRDINIVLIDCLNPFGNGYLLPFGFLREPLKALKRADVIILTHTDIVEQQIINNIIQKIQKINNKVKIFKSIHKPLKLINIKNKNEFPIEWFENKSISIFSGIGNSLSFELIFKKSGIKILNKYIFKDHHFYTTNELLHILQNEQILITTEKDYIRIENIKDRIDQKLLERLFYLKIEMIIFDFSLSKIL